jgi:hypothetical protein
MALRTLRLFQLEYFLMGPIPRLTGEVGRFQYLTSLCR